MLEMLKSKMALV